MINKSLFLKILSRQNLIVFGTGAFIGGGIVFLLLRTVFIIQKVENPIRQNTDFEFIKPLLFCSETKEYEEYKPLKEKVDAVIKEKIRDSSFINAAVYFRDLDSSRWMGINAETKYSAASLNKVPLMITYFKAAELNLQILNIKIPYTRETKQKYMDILENNIPPDQRLKIDNSYTLKDLINRMIMYSDNRAASLLVEYINTDALIEIYTDLGLSFPQNPGDSISTKSFSRFFRALYNASYLNRDQSNEALRLLTKTTYTKGIVAGLPSNITVAHKFGYRTPDPSNGVLHNELHDCGIIYYPGHPYLLCIMTSGDDLLKLEHGIKDISQTVYTEFISKP
ncbi:MAG: hypothetical protein A3F26_03570 [Candidatus Ryanbacteria bacterium RIFCSPHIGHO2_12_FULL_47_12b]|uniref:Beta-lactamase class A catalytic domain-containing protein n=2 Tax=Parcubacteria group TaxID=1794811 RepID=A0A1G2H197_9BACT|nr:MAG: Beta-lactamase class A-like protein [Parcubacteria group bacterium GW2011_GWA2_47_10b]KKU75401.1 MAG: Beta-lactamase class A-like protein [Candidatus Giovannonibacteria bacterium GW2011_GWB1_47_6b]OGZ51323.1 MAG: hypothetical protein A3A29_02635 [Candidatus Ryanbacteria bacterium RIFCSPLOWO2_01_FULL_47_79]OGZ52967.1 MAG: hypothetical protein A3F26_03570 [Candidatus Ryanbacteria bacterium RIFCSPHIGHO2_12_FULL_47_12b]OGZ56256.1 MAG: hypothetical protein A3J04_01305 [Candidatus Ryanbacteri